jgi:hypothetical protein
MKEMYYILGLAGWIWLALVAPLIIGAWIAQWRRRSAGAPNTPGQSAAPPRMSVPSSEPTDEKQP